MGEAWYITISTATKLHSKNSQYYIFITFSNKKMSRMTESYDNLLGKAKDLGLKGVGGPLVLYNPGPEEKPRDSLFSARKYDRYFAWKEGVNVFETKNMIRGLVLDEQLERVAAVSLPVHDLIVSNGLDVTDDDLRTGRKAIFAGIDGEIIRVFKARGKVYFSVNRKLDASASHKGDSINYGDAFYDTTKLDLETLFDANENPDYCYIFMLSGEKLRYVTREREPDDYVVYYLGFYFMNGVKFFEPPGHVKAMVECTMMKELDYDSAINVLTGRQDVSTFDQRLIPSDRVFVWSYRVERFSPFDLREISNILAVQSPAYTWRDMLMNGECAPLPRLWHMSTYCLGSTSLEDFDLIFPEFKDTNIADFVNAMVDGIPEDYLWMIIPDAQIPDDHDHRLYRVFMSLAITVPQPKLHTLAVNYNNMGDEFRSLESWLRKARNGDVHLDKHHRVVKILMEAPITEFERRMRILHLMSGVDLYQIRGDKLFSQKMSNR